MYIFIIWIILIAISTIILYSNRLWIKSGNFMYISKYYDIYLIKNLADDVDTTIKIINNTKIVPFYVIYKCSNTPILMNYTSENGVLIIGSVGDKLKYKFNGTDIELYPVPKKIINNTCYFDGYIIKSDLFTKVNENLTGYYPLEIYIGKEFPVNTDIYNLLLRGYKDITIYIGNNTIVAANNYFLVKYPIQT